jgi:hypothetical protein
LVGIFLSRTYKKNIEGACKVCTEIFGSNSLSSKKPRRYAPKVPLWLQQLENCYAPDFSLDPHDYFFYDQLGMEFPVAPTLPKQRMAFFPCSSVDIYST